MREREHGFCYNLIKMRKVCLFNFVLYMFAHPHVQSSTEKDHDQETLWTSYMIQSNAEKVNTCTQSPTAHLKFNTESVNC